MIDQDGKLVHEAYPFWPCRENCTAMDGVNCCHHSLFPVSKTEWDRVRAGLKHWKAEDRRELRLRARNVYESFAMHRYRGQFSALFKEKATEVAVCPFLVDGRCSNYEGRPVICRSYGYYMDTDQTPASAHWCAHVSEVVKERDVKRVPRWQAVVDRMVRFVKGPSKPLAAWLVEDFSP